MYRSVETSLWDDPRVKRLTPLARLLFLYSITCRHSHVSGIYILPREYVALETGLTTRQVDAALGELTNAGLVQYDDERAVLWVRRMLRHQGRGPSVAEAAARHLRTLHGSPLIVAFLAAYPAVKALREDAEWSALTEGGGEGPDTVSTPCRPSSVTAPDPVLSSPERGRGGEGEPHALTMDAVTKALRRRLGSSITPCRGQVQALVEAGWDLGRIQQGVEDHAEPGLAPWDWTRRVRGIANGTPHRATTNVGELLAAGRRPTHAVEDNPLALPPGDSR